MAIIHQFRHHAMATYCEVRIANVDATYAAQAALAAFDHIDELEARLSRFRAQSEIRRVATLQPGESLRLSQETYACLVIAKEMEQATRGAFSVTACALRHQSTMPQWTLSAEELSIRCESGWIDFDLGAIGKGFALDCAAELLRDWECASYLLNAGGSSILAGDAPGDLDGWSCGLGEHGSPRRIFLTNASLSGSGVAVKGNHILDPRTGQPALRQSRVWALCDTAAESDALSTAAMILAEPELTEVLTVEPTWLVLVEDEGQIRAIGRRSLAPHG
jgi:thiamine biosynthesis lipoprotein